MWWRAYTNIYSEALTRVLTIEGSGNPVERYPQLFAGLGKLEGEYSIRLQKGAQPYYALSVPTDIPICDMPTVLLRYTRPTVYAA